MRLLSALIATAAVILTLGACSENSNEPLALGGSSTANAAMVTPDELTAQFADDLEDDKAICQNTGARATCLSNRDKVMQSIRSRAGGLPQSLLRSELFESIDGWDLAYDEWKTAGCTNTSIEPECWTLPLDGQWTEVRAQLGF